MVDPIRTGTVVRLQTVAGLMQVVPTPHRLCKSSRWHRWVFPTRIVCVPKSFRQLAPDLIFHDFIIHVHNYPILPVST